MGRWTYALTAVAVLGGGCTPARRKACAAAFADVQREERALGPPATAPVAPDRARPSVVPVGPAAPLPPTRFLAGVEDLAVLATALPLPVMETATTCRAAPVHLPGAEAAARAGAREAGRRDVATTFAFGMAFPTGATPARFVDTVLDPDAEKAALSADEVTEVGRRVEGGRAERTYRIAMLDLGQGPFRYDFRWTLRIASEALADGRYLVRYDFDETAPRQRVSYFRGLAVVEPTAAGSFVREVIVAGSPVAPPFFLRRAVHDAAQSILARRWVRLVERSSRR